MRTKRQMHGVLLGMLVLPFVVLSASGGSKPHDIYLVIYVTKDGRTGHVGFAVDNYKIVGRDTVVNKIKTVVYDTIKNHSLTYFDLWGPATMNWDDHDKNLTPRYYTLPRSSAEARITPNYFLTKGLPHSYDYPCDALIRIKTSAKTDYHLKEIAEQVQHEKNFFNTRKHNCSDYAILCLNRLFNINLEAKEYIPFSWSSTPNKFYQEVVANLKVEIIKGAGEEVNNSFFKERMIKPTISNN